MTTQTQPVNVLILAGDRTADDPLCHAHGVEGKVLVPLAGVPLLAHVLRAVQSWPRLGQVTLIAPATESHRQVVESAQAPGLRLDWRAPQARLHDSVRNALMGQSSGELGLIVTGDHALLRTDWLDRVCHAVDAGADVAVGLASHQTVMAEFPKSKRTRYRFLGGSICGGNVFAFKSPHIMNVLDLWQRMEAERKRPWKMLSLLGPRYVMRYLTGRLSLFDAFARLSALTNVSAVPVVIDDGAVAVDIDSPEDLILAERAMRQRGQAGES